MVMTSQYNHFLKSRLYTLFLRDAVPRPCSLHTRKIRPLLEHEYNLRMYQLQLGDRIYICSAEDKDQFMKCATQWLQQTLTIGIDRSWTF